MPERLVTDLPSDFVNFLTDPGLDTEAGVVPLSQYLSLNPKNGGNARIDALLSQLRAKNIKDSDTGKNVDAYVGTPALTLLWKGQGHPSTFIKFMKFLCDNQDQFKGKTGELGAVYTKYFAPNEDVDALSKMVDDKYFGVDCIGFVANYLIHVGLWDHYLPYELDQWDRVFTSNVRSLEKLSALNLMVWPGAHVALIDAVYDITNGRREIDICQSSTGGPLLWEDVYLSPVPGVGVKGYQIFAISGGPVPVPGHVYVMSWPNLKYSG